MLSVPVPDFLVCQCVLILFLILFSYLVLDCGIVSLYCGFLIA